MPERLVDVEKRGVIVARVYNLQSRVNRPSAQ
jgi:hypothetical protein